MKGNLVDHISILDMQGSQGDSISQYSLISPRLSHKIPAASSMIHYIYTRELADDWQDLDIQDVTTAADMYDLPGWIELFPSYDSVAWALGNLVFNSDNIFK